MTRIVVTVYEPDDELFKRLSAVYESAGRRVRRVASLAELKSARGAGVASGAAGTGILIRDCESVTIHNHLPQDSET